MHTFARRVFQSKGTHLFEDRREYVVLLEQILAGVIDDTEHTVAKIGHCALGQLPNVLIVVVEQSHLSTIDNGQ
jgi:hypothetical protein